ncbi:MAG: hypothetical protein JNM21_17260 [Taibaiella sp.]|nr:hypothetical protein [Taibaiella sp.]
MKKLLILGICLMKSIASAAQDKDIVSPEVKALIAQADSCHKQGGEGCDITYKKALSLIRNTRKDQPAVIYNKLSYYYFNNNQSDSAKKYIELSIAQSSDPDNVESATNLKAHILYNEGHFDQAVKVYIELAKRLEAQHKTDKLAFTYGNIGNLYFSQNDYTNSLVYLHKSFDILQQERDTTVIATIAGNIADGYLEINKDSLAKVWAYKAIVLPNAFNPAEGKALGYTTLASLFSDNNTDSAIYYVGKAIDLAQKFNDERNLQRALVLKARIQKNEGNYKEAQKTIDSAIKLFRVTNYQLGLSDALLEAARISLKNQNYEKSALYFNEHITMQDSLRSKERYQTLGELTTRYETEKKERKIAEQELIIQRKNAQIRSWLIGGGALILGFGLFLLQYRSGQQRKLKLIEQENENAVLKAMMNSEERERRAISSTLHDSVAAKLGAAKMSLQSIPFLEENRRVEQLEKTAQLVSNIHSDVRSIAHHLLPVTLEKEGLVPALIEFVAEMNQLHLLEIKMLNQLPAGFSLSKREELILYRIVQELINNTIKHSKATEAIITLSLTDEQLKISVSDNGIGFNGSQEHQGLYSIRERMKSVGGTFGIENRPGNGTSAWIRLHV